MILSTDDCQKLTKSLDPHKDRYTKIEWVVLDNVPVSLVQPSFEGGEQYLEIGTNIQAACMHPRDLIDGFIPKFDHIAFQRGYTQYVGSGQDYRVYKRPSPPKV